MAAPQQDISVCQTRLQQYDGSWNCLQHLIKILQNTTLDKRKDIQIAWTFNCMSECLVGKDHYAEALINPEKAREIYQPWVNWGKDSYLATTLNNIGICLMELYEYPDAMNRFKESLKICEKFPLNELKASKIESI